MEMLGRTVTAGLIETVSSRTPVLSIPAPEPAGPTSTHLLFNRERTGGRKVYLLVIKDLCSSLAWDRPWVSWLLPQVPPFVYINGPLAEETLHSA